MYPDLSYFFHDLLGTNVDNWTSIFKTFGVFLALALLSAAGIVRREMIRKESEGLFQKLRVKRVDKSKMAIREGIINGIIGFFFGFKLPYILMNFPAFKADPSGSIFSMHGSWIGGIIGGLVLGGIYYYTGNQKTEATTTAGEYLVSPHKKLGDIMIVCAVVGVAGSRLFSLLENWSDFIQDPIGQMFSGSGLTIYGGLICCFIFVPMYFKKIGLNTRHMMDVAAPAIMIGYAVGRMGCHFAGDGDWGIVNIAAQPSWWFLPDWIWAYDYPHNVLQQGVQMTGCEGIYCTKLEQPVYPTPIYEITMSFIVLAILWVIRKRIKIAGMLFFIMLILNGIERFFIEGIRVNPRYDLLGMDWSLSQWIAIGFIITGIVGSIVLKMLPEEVNASSKTT